VRATAGGRGEAAGHSYDMAHLIIAAECAGSRS